MTTRMRLAGIDPDLVTVDISAPPEEMMSPEQAFARATAMKRNLQRQGQERRN